MMTYKAALRRERWLLSVGCMLALAFAMSMLAACDLNETGDQRPQGTHFRNK